MPMPELDDVSLPSPVSELDDIMSSPPLGSEPDDDVSSPPVSELDDVSLLPPVSELLLTPAPVPGLTSFSSSLVLDEHPKSKQTATSEINAAPVLTKCFDDIEHFSFV
jgi:hypothetical protein